MHRYLDYLRDNVIIIIGHHMTIKTYENEEGDEFTVFIARDYKTLIHS